MLIHENIIRRKSYLLNNTTKISIMLEKNHWSFFSIIKEKTIAPTESARVYISQQPISQYLV
jgi:hypothetical protein